MCACVETIGESRDEAVCVHQCVSVCTHWENWGRGWGRSKRHKGIDADAEFIIIMVEVGQTIAQFWSKAIKMKKIVLYLIFF